MNTDIINSTNNSRQFLFFNETIVVVQDEITLWLRPIRTVCFLLEMVGKFLEWPTDFVMTCVFFVTSVFTATVRPPREP